MDEENKSSIAFIYSEKLISEVNKISQIQGRVKNNTNVVKNVALEFISKSNLIKKCGLFIFKGEMVISLLEAYDLLNKLK